MIDWTVVLATLIGSGFTFLGTWLGYRGTVKTLEGENERLREGWAEEHLRHRQDYYHRTIIALDVLHKAITGVMTMWSKEFGPWLSEFRKVILGVTLFGRGDVRSAAEGMYDAVLAVEKVLLPEGADPSLGGQTIPVADLRESLPQELQAFEDARDQLLQDMQEDLARR